MLVAALLSMAALNAAALPGDADQPINITADRAELDNKSKKMVYRGSVQVDQGTLQVTADKMTVEYENQKVVRIIATGNPAHYRQQIEADAEIVKADAKTIVYHTQDEKVDLKGSAFLEQEGNTVTGDYIRYDIVAGKADAKANGDERVRMVLEPDGTQP